MEKIDKQKKPFAYSQFIDNVKSKMAVDIYSVINLTLQKNPYQSDFPKNYYFENFYNKNKIFLFLKSVVKFYANNFYKFIAYILSYFIFKIYLHKKTESYENAVVIDVFFMVENIVKGKKFNDNYFIGLYEILDKKNIKYVFLPRLYGVNKNPFILIDFFKIIKQDKRTFIFEFELLKFYDYIKIFLLIVLYPFKTLRLLQKEKSKENNLFNIELINDIGNISLESFTRYFIGKNISKKKISTIYSWSEFQGIERSFNYGVRTENDNSVKIKACQFFINYDTYLNSFVDDIDNQQQVSPHEVLVNGRYNILKREEVKYNIGVSLRYKKIFTFVNSNKGEKVLLLGSYIESETLNMLESASSFKNVIFKPHPATDLKKFIKYTDNMEITNSDIYDLFQVSNIVIGTASGALVEAVACGLPVILIASKNNLTANPLVDYGKGKIWDLAFNVDDVKRLYNTLTSYRKNNQDEIQKIASWYKDNFFIQPSEENIIKAFDLEGKR